VSVASRKGPLLSWFCHEHGTTRPVYHHKRESIEAHLSVMFAALAVSHRIEHQTGWSIKKFVRTTRRYRTVTIRAGQQTLTAADPLPDELRDALVKITSQDSARTNLTEVGLNRIVWATAPRILVSLRSGQPASLVESAGPQTSLAEFHPD
jgi:hypothetical protein